MPNVAAAGGACTSDNVSGGGRAVLLIDAADTRSATNASPVRNKLKVAGKTAAQ